MAAIATPFERRAFVVAPEPTDWLRPVLEVLERAGPVEVFAPWVLPREVRALGRRFGFVRRRAGDDLHGARGHVWFTATELILRTLARGETAATLGNRVRMRALVDRAAAVRLARIETSSLVVAPSLSARRTFAAAQCRGIRCMLLEDMPDFDTLVDGLDALARSLPTAAFLRNHRPHARAHARQRAERWQADVVGVRGRAAWERIGDAKERVLIPRRPAAQRAVPGRDVLFAGPPLARCGSMQLPHLLDALPHVTIRVLPGPCTEPPSLLKHPQVRVQRGTGLDGVGAVLSLSPLESHPSAVARALDAGIPIVGTAASTGVVDPASLFCVENPSPGALAETLRRALSGHAPVPRPWAAPLRLAQYVCESSDTADLDSAAAPSVRVSAPTT